MTARLHARPTPRLRARLVFIALAAMALGMAACTPKTERPSEDAAHGRLTVKTTAPDRHQAVLEIKPTTSLRNVQVAFVLPSPCHNVAGALGRSIPAVDPGQVQDSAVEFECSPGTSGTVTAEIKVGPVGAETLASKYEAKF